MPNIKAKNYNGEYVSREGVDKVWFESADEEGALVPFTYGEVLNGVEIQPDFSEGDMQISVPDGSLVKEATIIKPEDLTPENIRKGVTIGGIEGEFLGDTEEIEVELDMADGDQVILPSEDGKVISKAIVAKPDALAPENIRFGVNLAGIEGKYTGAEAKEVAVDLDFSKGDMVIAPEEDKVFSTVKIPKPDTLIPENIAKGVDIAGIVGTLAAGSGGVKVAIGTIAYYALNKEYTHNLGVIPDVIIYVSTTSATAGSTAGERYLAAFAISDAFASKNPSYPCGSAVKYSKPKWYSYTYSTPMDQATTTSANRIFNVTETTFTITSDAVSGVFIAIAGLT